MDGLEATARTDSSYNITAQHAKISHKWVTHIPFVFPGFRHKPRFHLSKSFLQKGSVDKRITEIPFKVTQSRKDSRDIFPVCLRVDRLVAQMRQTFGCTVRDQFLNRRLPKKINVECSARYSTGKENESPFLGADNPAVLSSTDVRYAHLGTVSRRTSLA